MSARRADTGMPAFDALQAPLQGTNLIEASAGTGKTYTITTLYLRLLLERRLQVSEILVVTYTNAATAELRARIRRRLRDMLAALEGQGVRDETLAALLAARCEADQVEMDRTVLRVALRDFDDAAIFTIHGFCQRMLHDNAFESGVAFDTQLVADQTPLRDEVVFDFWTRTQHAASQLEFRSLGYEPAIGPDTLARLATRVVAQPRLPVLPEHVHIDLAPSWERWQAAHASVSAIWRRDGDEIMRLLAAPGLNQTKYRRDRLPAWREEIDAAVLRGLPRLEAHAPSLRKCTTAALRHGVNKGRTPPEHPFFAACDELVAADDALVALLEAHRVQTELALVEYVRAELPTRKRALRLQSFDDLLLQLDDALEGPAGGALCAAIRRRFGAALIDEFQDTDPVQYAIFRRVYGTGGGALFLIGDPKQAIYGFRGADVFAYLEAKADSERAGTLLINRRSEPRLLEGINAVFRRSPQPFVFAGIPFEPMRSPADHVTVCGGELARRPPLQMLFVPRTAENSYREQIKKGWVGKLVEAVADQIVGLLHSDATLDGRRVVPSDLAVLCRTNDQAQRMQDTLRERRVPSVLHGDASVFDTEDARDLERVLRALAEPGDGGGIRGALITPLFDLDGHDLLALQADEPRWNEWIERFHGWHEVWQRHGFMPAFRRLLEDEVVEARILARFDGERRLTNLLHLGELLQGASSERRRGPLALVEWLQQMRRDPAARGDLASEAAQIRLESDARALQIVTVHKSKGLEYPIVFCPFLWDGALLRPDDREWVRFHDDLDRQRLKLDVGSPEKPRHTSLAEREALAENLRLLYVALTRARHRCVVAWGAFSGAGTSPLAYLVHGGAEALPLPDTALAKTSWLEGRSDAQLRADLARLAKESGGAIEVVDLPAATGLSYEAAAEPARRLRAWPAERRIASVERMSSFSALVLEGGDKGTDEVADHDEAAAEESVVAPPASAAEQQILLHDFPSSARSGQLLHDILERIDFTRGDEHELTAAVTRALRAHGFDEAWRDTLCGALAEVLETPLEAGAATLTLGQISAAQRLSEMEFLFPVVARGEGRGARGEGRVSSVEGRLTGGALGEVFARHQAPSAMPAYARRVASLGFAPLTGYLKGYVDLIFEHERRWYVVDYKSNFLGARPADYAGGRLAEPMAQHDYFLQYHLYVVALHRYLSARLPGYDYATHFGGVYYLFLRGMSPRHSAGCGVFFDRPQAELIEELSALMSGVEGTP